MNSMYWINKIMDTVYTNAGMEFWIGLSSTEPTVDGENISEPEGGSYSRVKISVFSEPEYGAVRNEYAIRFAKSTSIWFPESSPAQYWVLFDGNDSDANFLSSGALDTPKVVGANSTLVIMAGTLSFALEDYMPIVSQE